LNDITGEAAWGKIPLHLEIDGRRDDGDIWIQRTFGDGELKAGSPTIMKRSPSM
jgi:hypothetical protein